MGHGVSIAVASIVQSLVAANTVVNLSAVNIPVVSLADENTVVNSNAANIPVESLAAASMVNVAAMVSIATERERQRYALPTSSPAQETGEPFSLRGDVPADFQHPISSPANSEHLGASRFHFARPTSIAARPSTSEKLTLAARHEEDASIHTTATDLRAGRGERAEMSAQRHAKFGSECQCPSPGGGVAIADFGPIHHIPPCLEVIGAAILVV